MTVDHRLAQSYDAKSGKIELPQQARRDAVACQMCSWNEPEKHEFEHGFRERQELVEVIAWLRGRGAARKNRVPGKAGAIETNSQHGLAANYAGPQPDPA